MAAPAVGTKIQFWNSDLDTAKWEEMSEISDISGPDFSKDEIEVTALDTKGGFKSYIGGLKDAGNMTLEMNFDQKTFATMFDIFLKDGDAGVYWFAVILNDNATDNDKSAFWFQASVNQTPIRVSAGDRATATVTLRISGEPKFGLAGGSGRKVNGRDFIVLPADPTSG